MRMIATFNLWKREKVHIRLWVKDGYHKKLRQ